jgi:hypothetical protein
MDFGAWQPPQRIVHTPRTSRHARDDRHVIRDRSGLTRHPVLHLYYPPSAMARRSLRPELNRIRAWVRQGRTDAWIAHQLDVTVQQIQSFKRDQQLESGDDAETNGTVVALDDEIDLRAEDDALIAAELDAAVAEADADDEDDEEEADKPARRRRGRRGGRGGRSRRRAEAPLEATFDHGEEGYGLWLDPAVQDDAIYAEHWAGHRPVEVMIEEDQIIIRRAGTADDSDDGDNDADADSGTDGDSDSDE